MSTLKKEIKRAKELLAKLEYLVANNTHYDGHTKVLCVNVKRYNDDYTIDEALKNYGVKSIYWKKKIENHFDDDTISDIWWKWLNVESEQVGYDVKEDYGFNVYSCGRQSGYLYLDKQLDTVKDTISELKRCLENCDYIQEKLFNHTIADVKEEIDILRIDVQYVVDCFNYNILKALEYVDQYNKSLNFRDELEYRIEMYLEKEIPEEYESWEEFIADITGQNIVDGLLDNFPDVTGENFKAAFPMEDEPKLSFIYELFADKDFIHVYKSLKINNDIELKDQLVNYLAKIS